MEHAIRRMIELMEKYSMEINQGVAESEFLDFKNQYEKETGTQIDEAYKKFLLFVNGIEFDGMIFYAVDSEKEMKQVIPNIFESNKIWREAGLDDGFAFGEDDMSLFLVKQGKYVIRDKYSDTEIAEFAGWEDLAVHIIIDVIER